MDVNKISIKKIRELIVFTALIPIFREYVYLRLKKQHIKRVTTTEVEKYTEEDHPIQADN